MPAVIRDLVQTFLATEFSQAERHLRRLGKVTAQDARGADDPGEAGSTPVRTWGGHSMAGMTNDNQGKRFPLGPAVFPDGATFSIFSKIATAAKE
jgi:hypothetical protein